MRPLLVCLFFAVATTARANPLWNLFEAYTRVSLRWEGFREASLAVGSGACELAYLEHVRVSKEKPIELVIHGFGDSSFGASKTVPAYKKAGASERQLVFVDLPHHGRTRCDQVVGISAAARAVGQFIAKLEEQGFKVHRVHGISLGALVAVQLLEVFPNLQAFLFAPPMLEVKDAKALLDLLRPPLDRSRVVVFMNRVLTKSDASEFPGFVLDAFRQKIERGFKIFDESEIVLLQQKLNHLNLPRIRIFFGSQDRLFPESQRFLPSGFEAWKAYPCGHAIHLECEGSLQEFFAEALGPEKSS